MFGNILLFSVTASFWCLVSHNYTKKYCVATNIGMQVSELHRWAPSHNYVGVQCHRITPRCGVSQICTGVACPKNDTKMWCHRRALVYSVSELHSVLCYRIILVFWIRNYTKIYCLRLALVCKVRITLMCFCAHLHLWAVSQNCTSTNIAKLRRCFMSRTLHWSIMMYMYNRITP